jgi:hypothetical protein
MLPWGIMRNASERHKNHSEFAGLPTTMHFSCFVAAALDATDNRS